MRVMTVVGTRPEIIKLSRVIAVFDKFSDHTLVHTGQNYDRELSDVFFEDLGLRTPDYYLGVGGGTVMEAVAKILTGVEGLIVSEKPQALLLYGDTNSCLAALAAKRLKVPVFHMEAGNRCFDDRVPEEINRRIIDHISDINFCLTDQARDYLMQEGIQGQRIIKTGSHMEEVLSFYKEKICNSNILNKLSLFKGKYYIVSCHREENVDDPKKLKELADMVEALKEDGKYEVVVSTHPRTRKRLEEAELIVGASFLAPFGFTDYISLQNEARCVISDSGTICEESALLGFPAVTMRDIHERPEGMDSGNLLMAQLDSKDVLEKVSHALEFVDGGLNPSQVADYVDQGSVARKVFYAVSSYVAYINREVWKRGVEP